MTNLIFDSSVWVDFLNGKNTSKTKLLLEHLNNDEEINICPLIIQEILQGIRDDNHYKNIKKLLFRLKLLDLGFYETAIGAADIYRSMRKKGATIRKINDCYISFFAVKFNLLLVHNDKDFDVIAKYTDLKIYKN